MQFNNRLMKKLYKLIIVVCVLECAYLFALPIIANKFLETDYLQNLISSKTNAKLDYSNVKVKTHFLPAISLSADLLMLSDKNTEEIFINTSNTKATLKLLPLIKKKVQFTDLSADLFNSNIIKDKQGNYNFQKLFPSKNKNKFKFIIKNSNLNISELNLNFKDELLNKDVALNTELLNLNFNSQKHNCNLITKGTIVQDDKKSDFDINIISEFPFSKKIKADMLKGDIKAYGIDLSTLQPFIKEYLDNGLTELSGFIEFFQLSSTINDDNENRVILNTTLNDVIYSRAGWENKVIAKGANKFNANLEISDGLIEIKNFGYNANQVSAKADGTVKLAKTVELDINIDVPKSKAENILPLLPPNLPPELRTTEKAKMYEVYGDVEGKVNVKGKCPKPDITGYIKARNVHVLDKAFHHTHKGTLDFVFNKRTMDMDILVELEDKQNAKITGYTYLFREGLNHVFVKTTNNVDFPIAQKILVPIAKVFNMQLGPLFEMDIKKGKGNVNLEVLASIEEAHIKGFSSFDHAQITYNGLFGEVKDGKGRIDFNDDIISFKSERAFVKNNPLEIEGKVKINENLDFNISTPVAQADDVLEIINKSELLKDVKQGLAILTDASGPIRLFVNIKSKIVPVPYGHAPLPPEEAFEDMKVKGAVYLFGDECKIEGFYTPIEKVKGIVNFTETLVNLQGLTGVVGTSPLKIDGQILTDMTTKVPDVDIVITSKSVNLKDTIKFLTKSYLYPKEYPDLSLLYDIASKHDLYFKYKAKSIDFLTDKAYAVMNFIPDKADNPIKAKSGKVVMENAKVKVNDVSVGFYDSDLNVSGEVRNVDTVNPIYNLKIKSDRLNLENLNDTSKITIMPKELRNIFIQFKNYKGIANIDVAIKENLLDGRLNLNGLSMTHSKTDIPMIFDDFLVNFKKDKIYIDNMTANIGSMPFFGKFSISDYMKNPKFSGYITSKMTNEFLRDYIKNDFINKIQLKGDISLSADFSGTPSNLHFEPRLTLNQGADVIYDNTDFGETADKREFKGVINIAPNKINIKQFDYIKYISSQNNKSNPINFATLSGDFILNNNQLIPEKVFFKTNKNLSANLLNVFFKNKVFSQGNISADIKYFNDVKTNVGKLLGSVDCQSLNIPLHDITIKKINIDGNNNTVDIRLFGFISDSKISAKSVLENKITVRPIIKSLDIYADKINDNMLFRNLSQTHNAMNTKNNFKNLDLSGLSVENGKLEIKELVIKSMTANNFSSDFNINKNGMFTADNMKLEVGQGIINGKINYNLSDSTMKGDFELNNVDANYVAETLFDSKNQIYGNANGKILLESRGLTNNEIIKNLKGFVFFEVIDGRMPRLGSIEYLLRAGNIVKSGITGFTLNSVLELLNLVKTGYFSNINGTCGIENGIAKDIEIFSQGENMSLYIHGNYDISQTNADFEILGKLSKRISTIFGAVGNTSLNTFFKLIPGISLLDFKQKDMVENVEKIPSFTNGSYESRVFQAIINGNINETSSVQSFKWVE